MTFFDDKAKFFDDIMAYLAEDGIEPLCTHMIEDEKKFGVFGKDLYAEDDKLYYVGVGNSDKDWIKQVLEIGIHAHEEDCRVKSSGCQACDALDMLVSYLCDQIYHGLVIEFKSQQAEKLSDLLIQEEDQKKKKEKKKKKESSTILHVPAIRVPVPSAEEPKKKKKSQPKKKLIKSSVESKSDLVEMTAEDQPNEWITVGKHKSKGYANQCCSSEGKDSSADSCRHDDPIPPVSHSKHVPDEESISLFCRSYHGLKQGHVCFQVHFTAPPSKVPALSTNQINFHSNCFSLPALFESSWFSK